MSRFRFQHDGLFLLGCFAYALNRWALTPLTDSAFLHSHFNDLWLIPCALPLVLWIQHRLGLRSDRVPTGPEIFGHLILWSLLFEWIGPKFMSHATGDLMDVFCYWIGGLMAWLWWHRNSLRATRIHAHEF